MLKKQNQPVTPKDLNLPVAAVKEPQTIIMDGLILDEPLSTIGLNRHWLHTELDKLGVILDNVFLGQANSNGELTVDLLMINLKFLLLRKTSYARDLEKVPSGLGVVCTWN